MTPSETNLNTYKDRQFWTSVMRYLLGFEIFLQTTLFTLLMIWDVPPVLIVLVCATLLIAGRLALRVCNSRLASLTSDPIAPSFL